MCALAVTALLLATVAPAFALAVAPVLVLVAALISGTFPGEDLIDRIREQRSVRPSSRRCGRAPRPRAVAYVRPAGRLLAFALAMRPPPALSPRA